MQKITFILVAALLTGSSFAQEKSESVDSILKELGSYTGNAPAPSAPAPVEAVAEPVVEEVAIVEVIAEPIVEDVAVVEEIAVVEEVDVEELIEESRDFYVGGEFARAQKGFEKVVQVKPECIISRMYLRKLLERDQRIAEVSGMKAVTAAWNTDLVIRSYDISGDAVEKMGLVDAEVAVDVEVKFPEVDFKKGASAVYQPAMEKIFVRNTRDNLLIIEEILDAMDVAKLSADVEQVEIEAKFVEVSEGTLEELGFEWDHGAIRLGQGIQVDGSDYADALRGGGAASSAADGSLPFSRPDTFGAGSAGVAGDWTASRFEDSFNTHASNLLISDDGDAGAQLLISALDQSSGADVLSAPRIVTKSGETATIRVGQLHTYPEVYEPSATGGNIVHVKYDDWEEMLLGVELEVTPQVDGDQIELGLNPKFRELQGWQTYDVAGANSSYNWYQYRIGEVFSHAAIQAQLPIFRVREIETEVTIADGATIVMGGLINEKVEAFEDKVPVLGSLPLVGRLFRNEGERAIKRNLMMFVTAKIVEPTGRISSSRSFE